MTPEQQAMAARALEEHAADFAEYEPGGDSKPGDIAATEAVAALVAAIETNRAPANAGVSERVTRQRLDARIWRQVAAIALGAAVADEREARLVTIGASV